MNAKLSDVKLKEALDSVDDGVLFELLGTYRVNRAHEYFKGKYHKSVDDALNKLSEINPGLDFDESRFPNISVSRLNSSRRSRSYWFEAKYLVTNQCNVDIAGLNTINWAIQTILGKTGKKYTNSKNSAISRLLTTPWASDRHTFLACMSNAYGSTNEFPSIDKLMTSELPVWREIMNWTLETYKAYNDGYLDSFVKDPKEHPASYDDYCDLRRMPSELREALEKWKKDQEIN